MLLCEHLEGRCEGLPIHLDKLKDLLVMDEKWLDFLIKALGNATKLVAGKDDTLQVVTSSEKDEKKPVEQKRKGARE